MRPCGAVWIACALALCMGPAGALAQAAGQPIAPMADSATKDALHDMVRLAGVIFAGEVVAVRRLPANDGAAVGVEIQFAVDDAVRGVDGGSYTLREWAGLWAAGDEPFHVGQRYLMLLHAPGAAGLSSPVGGMDGAIPIRGGAAVDLRWIAARAVRPVVYRAASATRSASEPEDGTADGAPRPAQAAGYSSVISLLRTWERHDAAAR